MKMLALTGTLIAVGPMTLASPAHAVSVPDDMTGIYSQHAGGITVRPSGRITVSYQYYRDSDGGLPSFPSLVLRVQKVQGRTLTGRVVSQRESDVPVGARFTLKKTYPGARLYISQGSPSRWSFCNAKYRALGRCGA